MTSAAHPRPRADAAEWTTLHCSFCGKDADHVRFLAAGARPVILAGHGEAVIFDGTSARRVAYSERADLLALLTTDLVVVEGFKDA